MKIDVGNIEVKCKACGKTIGKLKDLFKFPHWEMEKERFDKLMNVKSLSLLSHNHIDCFCETWSEAEIQLQFIDDNDEFEFVYKEQLGQKEK